MKDKCLISVELSHENAPVEIRERLSFGDKEILALLQLLKIKGEEVFVLSTCNRFAIYSFTHSIDFITDYFKSFGDTMSYIEITASTEETANKLFRTAAGLRSQLLGEHEIIGQIKKAHQMAQEAGALGVVLDEFVRHAISVGKRVRTETKIGKFANSYSGVALSFSKRIFTDLENKKVLIIGTGKMAGLSAHAFYKAGISEVYVASHSLERATEFSSRFNGIPISMDRVASHLPFVDVVIGSTHEEVSIFNEAEDSGCQREQFGFLMDGKQRVFIDLGLPRNFNPLLRQVKGIELVDLDDLQKESDENAELRKNEVPLANTILNEEQEKYKEIFNVTRHNKALGAYWNKLESIKESRLDWLLPKMGEISEDQQELVKRFAHHLIRDLSKDVFREIRNEKCENVQVEKIQSMLSLNNISIPNN